MRAVAYFFAARLCQKRVKEPRTNSTSYSRGEMCAQPHFELKGWISFWARLWTPLRSSTFARGPIIIPGFGTRIFLFVVHSWLQRQRTLFQRARAGWLLGQVVTYFPMLIAPQQGSKGVSMSEAETVALG